MKNLQKAAKVLGLDKKYLKTLAKPQKIIEVNFPVKMDSGKTKNFYGYRVQHSNLLGPHKGGLRFHPECDLEETAHLAFLMTIKSAVLGLPYGGGKGGVQVNPKELSRGELERLTRAYTREIAKHVGPRKDIPAPDVYTNSQVMKWFYDEYCQVQLEKKKPKNKQEKEKITKQCRAVVTGKPMEIGGSHGRNVATALGGVYVLEEVLKFLKIKPNGQMIAIHGFGNAGSNMAKFLAQRGFKIIGVADSKATIISENKKGLNINKLVSFKKKTGSIMDFPGSKEIASAGFFGIEADILIPASLGGIITLQNAADIKAKIILELANGPVTPEADEILNKKEVFVIPDVLANAGGVTVSYFEWLQNLRNQHWSESKVFGELKKKMKKAAKEIRQIKQKYRTSFRLAAYILAIKRLIK
ncbi:Glu/Leu/Phe/Val dehydrogenase [Patescibacteria group bacterium]|nr:Glu/Leu/Phe/Val dehydrogenase [Patescibacteria group bacterium]